MIRRSKRGNVIATVWNKTFTYCHNIPNHPPSGCFHHTTMSWVLLARHHFYRKIYVTTSDLQSDFHTILKAMLSPQCKKPSKCEQNTESFLAHKLMLQAPNSKEFAKFTLQFVAKHHISKEFALQKQFVAMQNTTKEKEFALQNLQQNKQQKRKPMPPHTPQFEKSAICTKAHLK